MDTSGTAIDERTRSETPRTFWVDSEGRVARDMLCACGYNLRTLLAAGTCPECRRSVSDSIPQTLPLKYYPYQWLKQLRLGSVLFALGFVLLPVRMWLLGLYLGIWPRAVGQRTQPDFQWFAILTLLELTVPCVQLAGHWLLTSRIPAGRPYRNLRGRRVLRVCIPVSFAATLIQSIFSATMEPLGHLAYRTAIFANSLIAAAIALSWFSMVADLARRVPSKLLRAFSTLTLILCLFGLAAGMGSGLLQLAMTATALPPTLPYAMEEGAVPGQYIVFHSDGSMVRTTTVPASMLVPPAKRPAWLEGLYSRLATLGIFQVLEDAAVVSAGGQFATAIAIAVVLTRAIRTSSAMGSQEI